MMRWIPKDAGYISLRYPEVVWKMMAPTYVFENDEQLGLYVNKNNNICTSKTLQDSAPPKNRFG